MMVVETHVLTHRRWLRTLSPYLVFLTLGLFFFPSSGRDDVHITYWAAYTLSEYGYIVNYSGDYLEQSSSLLHTLLLAIIRDLSSFELPTIGGLCSVVCSLVAIWLMGQLSLTIGIGKVPAQLILATSTPFLYWSFGGLETTLVSAIVTWLVLAYIQLFEDRSPARIFSLLLAVICYILVRPESIFALCVFLVIMTILSIILQKYNIKNNAARLFYACLVFGILTYWRLIYFGDLFPQPVAAKIGSNIPLLVKAGKGLAYLMKCAYQYPALYLIIPLAIILHFVFFRRDSPKEPRISALVFSVAYILFIIFSGGDWMEGARFLVPIFPLLTAAVLMSCTICRPFAMSYFLLIAINLITIVRFAQNFSTGVLFG